MLDIGDRITVKATGQGLTLTHFPSIQLRNCSPRLLHSMGISIHNSTLHIPVAHILPASHMGSGTGMMPSARGDVDIMHAHALRLGDIIAIQDADTRYGRTYRENALSIGIVVHGTSILPGHGPGITTIMSANHGEICPILTPTANIETIL
jgi:hypothetical protein